MKFDPQLHLLRSVANAIEDPKQKSEAVSARFNLYAALEANDKPLARSWLDALEAAITLSPDSAVNARMYGMAQNALDAIRRGIRDE